MATITIPESKSSTNKDSDNFKFNIWGNWFDTKDMPSRQFICFNCSNTVASAKGYSKINSNGHMKPRIYICPHCNAANVLDDECKCISSVPYGDNIQKLPDEVYCVYDEVRKCMGVGAYTAAAMMLRKILMNFSVEKGAKEGDSFNNYVEFLCEEGYVHRANVKKAEAIKKLGNKANHKIEAISKEDSEKIFSFVSLLLKYNYEAADEE